MYLPHLEKPVDSWTETVINFVNQEIDKFIMEIDGITAEQQVLDNEQTVSEITQTLQNFKSVCAMLSIGHLARTILDCTHVYRANKNWNSACILDLDNILASLEHANKCCQLKNWHMELIPKGKVQTRAKHGNCHVSYVEYMCLNYEQSCEFEIPELVSEPPRLQEEKAFC